MKEEIKPNPYNPLTEPASWQWFEEKLEVGKVIKPEKKSKDQELDELKEKHKKLKNAYMHLLNLSIDYLAPDIESKIAAREKLLIEAGLKEQ